MVHRIIHRVSRFFRSTKIGFDIFLYNAIERKKQQKTLIKKIKNVENINDLLSFNSSHKRAVEITEQDYSLTDVIVTCYFTLKPDPQSGNIRNAAEFRYIQPWYDSMMKIGTQGIILHDGLDQLFINQYSNDQIQFRYCTLGDYSIFEERWLLYHLFLKQLPQLKKIFFTDSNDVYITKNPFPFIANESALYVGRDNANRIKDSGWLKEECDRFVKESNYKLTKTFEYQWVYNAGVTGGSYPIMLFLTQEMSKLIFCATSNFHKDMTLLNLVIHEHFYPQLSKIRFEEKLVDASDDSTSSHDQLITGFPFNSAFKGFEYESNAYFIHK